jgi:hypothetical protein
MISWHNWNEATKMDKRIVFASFMAAIANLGVATQSPALTIDELRTGSDITATFGGTVVESNEVGIIDAGVVSPEVFTAIPQGVEILAYHFDGSNTHYFSVSTAITLPGGSVVAESRDIVSYDGSTYSIALDGRAANIPAGVAVDAVSRISGQFVISFSSAVEISNSFYDRSDLVRFNSGFSMYWDASANNVDAGMNVDGVHILDSGRYVFSFDIGGSLNSISFQDEDLMLFTVAGSSWSMMFNAESSYPAWGAADLQAVYLTVGGNLIFKDGFESGAGN